jgi:[ribosomal protein S18]-alanine N-acetyltransferase
MKIRGGLPEDKEWTAQQMAHSDPWMHLGITLVQCKSVCFDPAGLHFIGERMGAVVIQPKGLAGSPYLKTIIVKDDARNKKIGEALMTFSEDLFRKESRHFFLCVSSFNLSAQEWYRKLGYSSLCVFKDYIISGADEILMYKKLS